MARQQNVFEKIRDRVSGSKKQERFPKIDLSKVELPKIDLSKVDLPKVQMPQVNVPEVHLPNVQLPKRNVPKFHSGRLKLLAAALAAWAVGTWINRDLAFVDNTQMQTPDPAVTAKNKRRSRKRSTTQ